MHMYALCKPGRGTGGISVGRKVAKDWRVIGDRAGCRDIETEWGGIHAAPLSSCRPAMARPSHPAGQDDAAQDQDDAAPAHRGQAFPQ